MVQNAFTTVRPRGPDLRIPAKLPKRNKPGAALTVVSSKAMDTRGRRVVDLAPRAAGNIVIESREQAQASVDRRAGISKAGTK